MISAYNESLAAKRDFDKYNKLANQSDKKLYNAKLELEQAKRKKDLAIKAAKSSRPEIAQAWSEYLELRDKNLEQIVSLNDKADGKCEKADASIDDEGYQKARRGYEFAEENVRMRAILRDFLCEKNSYADKQYHKCLVNYRSASHKVNVEKKKLKKANKTQRENIYFGGSNPDGDGYFHGHAVISTGGEIIYLRLPFAEKGEAIIDKSRGIGL